MTNTAQQEANRARRENAVQTALAQAYTVFGRYRAPTTTLDVCLNCCVDEEVERAMRERPLRELSAMHFCQYNTSAKSPMQPAEEIKYFLPRMLELLVQRQELHHSTELFLDRVGRCEADAFSAEERGVLDALALALFAQGLEEPPIERDAAFMGENAFTVLLMWDIGGVGIQPLLEHWLRCDSAASTLQYVEASFWDYWNVGRAIDNPFASDRPAYRAALEAWLNSAPNRAHYAGKILALTDSGAWADWYPDSHHGDVKERAAVVFCALVE